MAHCPSPGAFNIGITGGSLAGTITQTDATITLSGTITQNAAWTFSTSSTAQIALRAATTLNGNGTITLAGSGTPTISNTNNSGTLTLGAGQTIQGFGSLNPFALTNAGTVIANSSGKKLTVAGDASTVQVNTGFLKATDGGILELIRPITNTSGTILADGAASQVLLNNNSITNGTVSSANAGVISCTNASGGNIAQLTNVVLNGAVNIAGSTTALSITDGSLAGTISQSASSVVTLGGTINHNAAWTVTTTTLPASKITIGSATTLNGAGSITLVASNIACASSSARLTLASGQTIQGYGTISSMALTTAGTVNANVATRTLTLAAYSSSVPIVNTGVLEATNGGILKLWMAFTNTNGTILADGAGSKIQLFNAVITDGALTTINNGTAAWTSGPSPTFAALRNVAFSGDMTIAGATMSIGITGGSLAGTISQSDNTTVTLSGAITQNATWTLSPVSSSASIAIGGDTTLNGTGSLVLAGTGTPPSISGSSAVRLTLGAAHTVQGFGSISAPLTNGGTINANLAGKTIALSPTAGPLVNTGTLEATAGGTLAVNVAALTNTGGTVLADAATVTFTQTLVTGGTLALRNGGQILFANGATASSAVSIDAASAYTLPDNIQAGPIENHGTLTTSGPASASDITGTGQTTLPAGTSLTTTSIRQSALTLHGDAANTAAKVTITESSPGLPGTPSGNDAVVSVLHSLAIDNDGSGAYFATLDLTNNDLLLDYTGGTSPLTTIEAMVRAGYHSGDWTGTGLTSSTAAANPGLYALVVLDNATRPTPFPSFDGIDTSSHQQIIVKFSWVADIDLDGLVTSNDAIAFAANYSDGAAANHQTGDLNYNGLFDSGDAILFATAYNESLPHLPEPASLTLLALGALALLQRKRS